MRIFVTGTDTGVGKTLVSAWLAHHLVADYWKPIQCGIDGETDSETVARLSGRFTHPEAYRLQTPRSPHVAAAREDLRIEPRAIAAPPDARLIIEGAGGVLVPLNERDLMVDLMVMLGLPVLIVARAGLGTINATLLTLEALRKRDLSVLGVVLSGELLIENVAALETYGHVRVLGYLPQLEHVDGPSLCAIPLPEPLGQMANATLA